MTRARELSKLGNQNIFSVDSNLNVGVGSTATIQPPAMPNWPSINN